MGKPHAVERVATAGGGIECETLLPRWDGPIIVAATGESLTKEVAEQCRGYRTIVVKQAALRMPWADALYNCESYIWDRYDGFKTFQGERWSAHNKSIDYKLHVAERHGLRLVCGERVVEGGFASDPSVIYYANNAGFQAIGMAIHWLRKPGRIVLVGFDMSGRYFYGHHPKGPQAGQQFSTFIPHFEKAARMLPEGVEIVNATPGSGLKCFPMMSLEQALA